MLAEYHIRDRWDYHLRAKIKRTAVDKAGRINGGPSQIRWDPQFEAFLNSIEEHYDTLHAPVVAGWKKKLKPKWMK